MFSLDLLESELGIKNSSSSRPAPVPVEQPVDITNKGVKLKTRLNGKHEAKWIVVEDDTFGKLKDKFAALYKISLDRIKSFEFDGEELDSSETPLDQDMEDGDLIDAKIDASLLEGALAAAAKPKQSAQAPSSSSSSSSSSASDVVKEEKMKSAALDPENRLQQKIKLRVLSEVSSSGEEINTELKVFGDFTFAKIHAMLSKAGTGIFTKGAPLPSYTIERAQGGSKLLPFDEEIINLNIDNETIIVRPANIGIVIIPQNIKNNQNMSVEEFGVNVSPLTPLSRFIDSLISSGYLIHPKEMLKFQFVSKDAATGKKKKGAKPKKKLVDLATYDEDMSLFDCGFTDATVLECSLR